MTSYLSTKIATAIYHSDEYAVVCFWKQVQLLQVTVTDLCDSLVSKYPIISNTSSKVSQTVTRLCDTLSLVIPSTYTLI